MQTTIIIFLAAYLYLFVISGSVLTFLFSHQKKQLLSLALFTIPLAFLLSLLLTQVVYSPRPFLITHILPFIHSASDNGFPSDHTLLVATLGLIMFTRHKRSGLVLLVFSLCVGIGRVLAGVHHPIDILGSFAIAGLTTFLVTFFLKKIPQTTLTLRKSHP